MSPPQEFYRQWVDGGSVYDRKLKRTATQDLRILKDQLVQIRMNARPANGGTSIRIGARGNQAKTRFRLITVKTNEGGLSEITNFMKIKALFHQSLQNHII